MSRKRLISNTSIVFAKNQRVPSKRYKENFDKIRWKENANDISIQDTKTTACNTTETGTEAGSNA
jgi:hypothetical protein